MPDVPWEAKSPPAENHCFVLKQTVGDDNRMTNKKGFQVQRNGGCSSEVRYTKGRRGAIGFGHKELLVRRALELKWRTQFSWREWRKVCADPKEF